MAKFKAFCLIIFLFTILFCLNGCSTKSSYSQKSFYIMGETVKIQIDPKYEKTKSLFKGCENLLDSLEKELSPDNEQSDFWLINEFPEVSLRSIHSKELLETAFEISEMCPNFDLTVGAYVDIWNRAAEEGVSPTAEDILSARNAVGYDKLSMSGKRVIKPSLDIKINVDGIVYGYVADMLVDYLEESGVKYGIVYVGNCAAVFGKLPQDSAFKIAVTNREQTIIGYIYLTEGAMCTTHSTDRIFNVGEESYCGWISPFSGYPVSLEKESVVIVAESAAVANALSTGNFISDTYVDEFYLCSEIDFEYIAIINKVESISDGIAGQFEYVD